jgi:hypothetical protein
MMTKYAVMIEVDHGEWMYLSEDNPFSYASKPRIFNDRNMAEATALLWNTGYVVEYKGDTEDVHS